jgi:hypothetical protein
LALRDSDIGTAVIRPISAPAPARRVFVAVRTGRADNPLITAILKTFTETAAALPLGP